MEVFCAHARGVACTSGKTQLMLNYLYSFWSNICCHPDSFSGKTLLFQQDNAKLHSEWNMTAWCRVLHRPVCSPRLLPIVHTWCILMLENICQRRPKCCSENPVSDKTGTTFHLGNFTFEMPAAFLLTSRVLFKDKVMQHRGKVCTCQQRRSQQLTVIVAVTEELLQTKSTQ